jgi:hypothetical protein
MDLTDEKPQWNFVIVQHTAQSIHKTLWRRPHMQHSTERYLGNLDVWIDRPSGRGSK